MELGRLREPDHPDVACTRADGDDLEPGRAIAAAAHRTRGSAGPDRGPRRRILEAARLRFCLSYFGAERASSLAGAPCALNQFASAGGRIFCALPPTNVPMCPPGTASSV